MLISTSYPQTGDGSEAAGSFVRDLVDALVEEVDVHVVAPGVHESLEHNGCIHIWRYAAGKKPLSLLSSRNPKHWYPIFATLASMRRQAHAAASIARPSHILALWVLPSGWVARSIFRRWGTRYSVWALGSDIWTLGRIPFVRGLLRSVSMGAARTFADGLELASDAERITGRRFEFVPTTRSIAASKVRVRRLSPPYRLLFLGRWHPNKGVDLLLDALVQLTTEDWSMIESVHVYGGGPLDMQVKSSVVALQSRGRKIEVFGYVNKQQATDIMMQADWLIIPSRIESIPVVFSDAMKLGLPVVSTPVGDLRHLVAPGNRCGMLAEAPTSKDMAAAIGRALRAPPEDCTSGIDAMASRFDLTRICAQFLQGLADDDGTGAKTA